MTEMYHHLRCLNNMIFFCCDNIASFEAYRGTFAVQSCLCFSCEFYLPISNSILNQEGSLDRWNPSLRHIWAFLSPNAGTIFGPHVLNTLSTFNIIHARLSLHMTNIDWELQFIFYEHLKGRLFRNPARRRQTLQRHSIKWNFCCGEEKWNKPKYWPNIFD